MIAKNDMAAKKNPFDLNNNFHRVYFELQIKYNSNFFSQFEKNLNYDLSNLIKDLEKKLECEVEILKVDPQKGAEPLDTKKNQVFNKHDNIEQLNNILENKYLSNRYRGETTKIDLKTMNDTISEEIDILPLSFSCPHYLLILIGSRLLLNHKLHNAERNFQRLLLNQLLIDWWLKITPSKELSNDNEENIAWLNVVPINELIKLELDRNSKKSLINKRDRSTPILDWTIWNPPLLFYNLDEKDKNHYREFSQSLIYWCRWIDSHKDIDNRGNKYKLNGEDSKLTRTLNWIELQRKDNKEIEDNLDILNQLCAKEFIKGSNVFNPNNVNAIKEDRVLLQNKSLLIYGLNKWINADSNFRKELFSKDVLSNIEFCRSLHAIGSIAHYLFCQQDFTEDINHRLMQLIANYGHTELEIPFRIDLRAHLLHAARGESALYVLKAFYRDHFFHAIEVCFLGHFILEIEIEDGKYFWEIVGNILNITEKKKVLQLWYVASLLHDVGYAIDMFNNSQRHLEFFKHSKAIKKFTSQIRTIKEQLIESSEVSNLQIGELFKGVENDHGIIGALHLQALIEKIENEDDDVKLKEFEPAIQAIALHNLRKKENKINFSENPIAFLLAFCDQIQEWNRIKMPYSTSPNIILSSLVENGVKKNNSMGGICNVYVHSVVSTQKDGTIKFKLNDNRLEFTLEYDEQINRNSNVFGLWLDSTLNFQRLEIEELPFDVKVNFKTPYFYNKDQNVKTPQLYRLRNAAYETHMSFLSDWFPNESNGEVLTNGAVDYYKDGETELLSLDLKKLSQKRRMTKDMGAFYTQLSKWKHYNDDKEFPGDYVEVHPE